MSDHKCEVKSCGHLVPNAMLMCAAHWKMVPRPLQLEIYAALRTWRRQPKLLANALALREVQAKAGRTVYEKELARHATRSAAGDTLPL